MYKIYLLVNLIFKSNQPKYKIEYNLTIVAKISFCKSGSFHCFAILLSITLMIYHFLYYSIIVYDAMQSSGRQDCVKNTNDKILQISIYSDGCRASYRTASEITKCMTSCFERIMTIIIQ